MSDRFLARVDVWLDRGSPWLLLLVWPAGYFHNFDWFGCAVAVWSLRACRDMTFQLESWLRGPQRPVPSPEESALPETRPRELQP